MSVEAIWLVKIDKCMNSCLRRAASLVPRAGKGQTRMISHPPAPLHNSLLHCTIEYYIAQSSSILQNWVFVLHNSLIYCTIVYYIVLLSICIAQFTIISHDWILYCTNNIAQLIITSHNWILHCKIEYPIAKFIIILQNWIFFCTIEYHIAQISDAVFCKIFSSV